MKNLWWIQNTQNEKLSDKGQKSHVETLEKVKYCWDQTGD